MTYDPFGPQDWTSPQSQAAYPQTDPRKIAEGWLDMTPAADHGQQAIVRVRTYRPTLLKKVLAWVSVGFGVFLLLPLTTERTDFWDAMATMVLGLVFALPGAYWLVRNRSDQRTIAEWAHRVEEQRQLRFLLPESDRGMLGAPEPTPLLPKRRWGLVVGGEVALFVLFGILVNLAV